jgi:hypothetical protein
MSYRISRNVEASIIDYITAELTTDGWIGVRVEKAFAEVYRSNLPCLCINVSTRPDKRREIGTNSLSKFVNIEIRIFATSDGQRLDLADWLLEKVMPGIAYYSYTITDGMVSEKTLTGRINILEIVANRKELVNLEGLSKEDRYRHLLSLRCRVATTV